MQIPLRDIQGEHSLVRDLDDILNLPPFPQPPTQNIPEDVVRHLLQRMPLLVCNENGATACIGNTRLYRLAHFVLQLDDLVPTIQYSGSLSKNRREHLKQGLLTERFLMPAIFGRRKNELLALSSAWKSAKHAKLLDSWKGVRSFPELYGQIPDSEKRTRAPRHG